MTTTRVMMTTSDADARREAQRTRILASRIKKRCPKCDGDRLFPMAGIGNQNRVLCYDCGARYERKR